MSAKWSMKPQRVVGAKTITTLNVLIGTGLVLAGATSSFVGDDLLAHAAEGELVSAQRGFALGGVLLGLAVVGGIRWLVRRAQGTLFYVQILGEGMRDERKAALERAKRNQLASWSVLERPSLQDCTANGVIDVHEYCEKAGSKLGALLDLKQGQGRSVVVPNILWPMALAMGGQLSLRSDLRLRELASDLKDPDQEFRLTPRSEMSVELDPIRTDAGPDGSPVGVILEFTKAVKLFQRTTLDEHGVTQLYRIIPNRQVGGELGDYTGDQLASFTAGIAEKLKDVKNMCGGSRDLVVVAMISKTQALALGWHLARLKVEFSRNTHLMHFDLETKRLIPMRVWSSQPTRRPWPPAPQVASEVE